MEILNNIVLWSDGQTMLVHSHQSAVSKMPLTPKIWGNLKQNMLAEC